jgi:2-polyprenyl-6-methoxyphenol hydroxylase-like FAD-dependent oxidoreductase
MSPFAGEGANLAMLDGAELGVTIASVFSSSDAADTFDSAIIRYEQEMFLRGNAAVADSYSNMTEFISEEGVARGVALMRKVVGMGGGPPDGGSTGPDES